MATTNNQALHWILGAALLLIVVFVVGALLLAQSQAGSGEVTIANVAPTIDVSSAEFRVGGAFDAGPKYGGGIINDLSPGSSDTPVYISVEVTDDNGTQDLTAGSISFVRSDKTHANCDDIAEIDQNYCYFQSTAGTCGFFPLSPTPSDTSKQLICSINVKSQMDATGGAGALLDNESRHWDIYATVTDGALEDSEEMTLDFNVFPLTSISLSGDDIDFGTVAAGTSPPTADAEVVTITNEGNVPPSLKFQGNSGAFNCTGAGSIPVANLKFSNALFSAEFSGTQMDNLAPVSSGYVINQNTTNDTYTQFDTYWNLTVSEGTDGVCTIGINMTADNSVAGAGS
jgi:hypothetical protein